MVEKSGESLGCGFGQKPVAPEGPDEVAWSETQGTPGLNLKSTPVTESGPARAIPFAPLPSVRWAFYTLTGDWFLVSSLWYPVIQSARSVGDPTKVPGKRRENP